MSPKMPVVTPKIMASFLEYLGFNKMRQRGSHNFFRHPDGRTATVPNMVTPKIKKNTMLKKYQHVIQKINSFDFSDYDDSDLLECIINLKAQTPDYKAIPEILAIIKEVIDRRLGIWKLFDSDLPEHFNHLRETYTYVKKRRSQVDSSQIHLGASFYAEVRRLRQPHDGLTFMPFDVQLLGALALLEGKIAEMGTGEGKTVVAVSPACIWALSGKKVHIATVNDYLALRDCMWMGRVYKFLGLEVDCVLSHMPDSEKRTSYKADIVYGNNYEFGFDYLRDNLRNKLSDRVQSKLECVIIDEIDSILMDEATTPLIISGTPDKSSSNYWRFKSIIESLIKHQNEIIDQLFKESDSRSADLVPPSDGRKEQQKSRPSLNIIRLIQIRMADPWNPQLLDYLSNDNDTVKKMNSVHGKFIAMRSEYKLEEDLIYVVDEKNRTLKLTDMGITFVEDSLGKGFFTLTDQQTQQNPHPFQKGEVEFPLENAKHQTSPLLKGGRGDFNNLSKIDTPELRGNENVRNFLQLLRAYILHRKDEDYIVHNGGIIIVDEFTGRLAFGKKYEEGLHQAIECKEGLQVTPETRVMGKITHPNYFRFYEKKSGMTATAHTEAEEFKKLYKLEVVRIPTNKPVIRTDLQDRYFRTEEDKLKAIVDDIKECHAHGQPVLIGTRSVEKSEYLSKLLKEQNIPHSVLNAKNHSEEADIIKNAGQPYAVTIATNMAGRGVDITLKKPNIPPLVNAITQTPPLVKTIPQISPLVKGGRGDFNQGLHVIGTERHTARRIDDQLIGRSGRQGDPGSSRFYLSLQDDLLRMYAGEDMPAMVRAVERGYNHKMTNLTRKVQRKSEETSYSIRKNLIEHDDVADKQRKVIYKMRSDVLSEDTIEARVQSIIEDYADDLIILFGDTFTKSPEFCHSHENGNPFSNHKPSLDSSFHWNDMKSFCIKNFGVYIPDTDLYDLNTESAKAFHVPPCNGRAEIVDTFQKVLKMREQSLSKDFSNKLEKAIMMEVLDTAWTDYLSYQSTFDNVMLLRSYVKDNILTHYKLESAKLFKDLLASIRYETLKLIFTYPLPDEKADFVRKTDKPISDHVKKLLKN
jgi:preprotein translocase subunit SecA